MFKKKKSVYILVTDKYRYCRYIANIPMILNLVPRYVLGSNFFSRPERVKTLIKWRFSKYCLRAQRPPRPFSYIEYCLLGRCWDSNPVRFSPFQEMKIWNFLGIFTCIIESRVRVWRTVVRLGIRRNLKVKQ